MTVVPIDPERCARPADDWAGLICAVAERRDREAFARLFAHFAPRIKRHLMLGGSPEAQAEELAQETLAAVWRKAALFDPARAAASTWIFTIARHLRVDLLRRHQGDERLDEAFDFDGLEADEPAAEERLHATRLNERLRGALAQLPPEQQRVLRLSYFDDESHAHIAAELGIPLGTVKSRMRLAVSQLRRLLER
ncbi:sigma-70 family RNA polymerase sigma factor [Roseateles sp. DAIF2]|uniref:sigma-70 family RNA polymerase sigma factor n=1 Tax=Roseateles sp. DAIF2 TaxID=2714952 RepID=UPI0018A316E7|nr:sigma-70 family RNA polymerase sigma factor [Roseateles sp. DAIF2]QPF74510.1 sigma-70 family RNA polymerase sigma factor [Roseateles sp. DAIF2]